MLDLAFVLQHCCFTLLLSIGLTCVSYIVETSTYKCLTFLEKRGVIERLAPQIPTSETHYQKQVATTFLLSSWFVLLIALYPPVLNRLIELARPRWNPIELALTCWIGVVLHDFWFFSLHHALHKNKTLYRKIHVLHHRSEGDLTVFGTADMDPLEAIALVFGFYATALLCYAFVLGSWNPVSYTMLVLLEASMNMMGHCGYRQPLWLAVLQSWGVCFTPGVAHAKTHYIHHLDPRCNRALYFTWWDRAIGTFRGNHPAIREFTPEEQWEYELRAFVACKRAMATALQHARAWLKGRELPGGTGAFTPVSAPQLKIADIKADSKMA